MSGSLHVVAPHATRTGSTKVLRGLLEAAGRDLGLPVTVELLSGGPLAEELLALGSEPGPDPEAAVVLANTSLAASALLDAAPGTPTAVYVHEAAEVLTDLPADARAGLARADLVLCVSELIADDVGRLGTSGRIAVLPPLVAPVAEPDAAAVAAARRHAGASPGDHLVVACGEAGWRKGADLFVQLARHLDGTPPVRLAWAGRRIRPFNHTLDHDARLSGVAGRLAWLGDLADPLALLAAADVVVMTSRHDPQPLVPLEAAQVGTPTVGFAVGGLADLARAGASAVAPFPDCRALADVVREVLQDPARAAALAEAGRRRIQERQAPDVVVPRFVAEVRSLLV